MEFDHRKLTDPGFFAENRVPAHSDHAVYASDEELARGESSLRCSLNGPWKFFWAQDPAQIPADFARADFDCSGWADIAVPAHMQLQGYGTPQYCNVQYPWDGHEELEIGQLPKYHAPVGCYVRRFTLPENMRGKRVFISFQGAESCVALWLNGHYIGFSSDSFTPADFELTGHLVDGENKLACRVYQFSAGSWLEDQDFFRFAGLFRDVFLYATPAVHVQDLTVKTLLDSAYRDAVLQAELHLTAETDWRLRLRLATRGGGTVVSAEESGAGDRALFRLPVTAPRKWSAEDPFLYELTISVLDGGGTPLETVSQPVGFRRFEIRDGLMLLNGRRIVFKGVNRHDFCAESGRAVTPESIRRDLITMKRHNINAVRTCHYPDHSALYRLCDELGLYVIDENNMESHGTWGEVIGGKKPLSYALPGDRTDWQDMLLDRVNSTFQRDKNHPCVLLWSLGNESFGGSVIHEMCRLFHRLDDTRPVHYEGIFHDRRYNDSSDVESQMYTSAAGVRQYLAEHRDKPFILCEYSHAMGNSLGAMHKYTEYAYEEPLFQGGFLWDFKDQALLAKDRYGETFFAYGGDFGDQPNDGNFCGDGIVYADGSVSPKMQEVKYNYQDIVAEADASSVRIVNRHLFTSTAAYDCAVTLARDGVIVAGAPLKTDVPPLEERTYPLPFPRRSAPGEYAVTVSFRLKEDAPWADRGHEVAFGQYIYKIHAAPPARPVRRPLAVAHGEFNLGVRGESFEALFSYAGGGLASYRYGGREMLRSVPMPNFWRAPTDNDRGNLMPQRYAQWKLASLYATNKGAGGPAVTELPDGSVSVRFVYLLPTAPKAQCAVTYTVRPDGAVDVALRYDPVEGLGDMPAFGMLLKMDADYDRVRWYGMGPEENYADRCRGARLGVWDSAVRDRLARYLVPQECGSMTGVRWAEVTDSQGRGLRFSGDGMEFSALPYTPHELENAAHPYELAPAHYTVVRASLGQMGLGGDDSWGARTHEEYLLDASGPMEFTFRMEGI